MEDIFKKLIFLLLIFFLIGCTTYIPINVESDPPGLIFILMVSLKELHQE